FEAENIFGHPKHSHESGLTALRTPVVLRRAVVALCALDTKISPSMLYLDDWERLAALLLLGDLPSTSLHLASTEYV
uniref:Uncharacterized protein n=1 Tax=Romanomermis culicivorax TaxID=13658 RepID=A0A915JZC6_ROMCU